MPVETSIYRARIGIFNGTPYRGNVGIKNHPNARHVLFDIVSLLFDKSLYMFESFFTFFPLLLILTLHIFGLLLIKFHTKKYKHSFKSSLLCAILCDQLIIFAFVSILNRSLLIQSGTVERNPGPPPRLLSFATWNVDSLLARDGIKKSYLECIRNVHSFDVFGICESYLTRDTLDDDLKIDGFADTPLRSDCKIGTRPKGGVCLFYKSDISLKRREDLENLDEMICAEITLNRKKIIRYQILDSLYDE